MEQVYNGFVSRHLNRHLSRPIARLLSRTPITPNQVSMAALGMAGLSCLSFLNGHPKLGGTLAQASSVVDGADGDLARMKQSTSAFGGYLDAMLDRYADAFIILGLTFWAAENDGKVRSWLVGFSALAGTFGISYSRARIKGVPPTFFDRGAVSLATRDVRLFLIMLGSLLGYGFGTLVVLGGLTNAVVILRLLAARRALSQQHS